MCYNLFMKRAVVFAHYDKQNIVDDYVVFYLKELKKLCDEIVFVSCNPLENPEIFNGIVSHIIDETHNEYDFGSYKRGYLYLKNRLKDFDELIFANDSCYAPIYPFEELFNKMNNAKCDFWGITKNNFGYRKNICGFRRPHIQSYFIVFKKNVFTSEIFDNFISSIKQQKNKRKVISEYEIGLSEVLYKNGFTSSQFINVYENINNIPVLKWRKIIQDYNMPFLKCSIPRLLNREMTTAEGWEKAVTGKYPVELIYKNIERLGFGKKNRYSCSLKIKQKFFDFISKKPFLLRKLLVKSVFIIFPCMKD